MEAHQRCALQGRMGHVVCRARGTFRGSAWLLILAAATAQLTAAEPSWPLILRTDFAEGRELWQVGDPAAWELTPADPAKSDVPALLRLVRQSQVQPPFRSPLNQCLLRYLPLTNVQLTVEARSTARDYDHRSLCLFFGYQDPAHFYYVHYGKKTDDRANQIFIVNGADRVKISTQTTPGTPWDDSWHTLRVTHDVATGEILAYFDHLEQPAMRAVDTTFTWGRVGFGSFDDVGDFRAIELHGQLRGEDAAK